MGVECSAQWRDIVFTMASPVRHLLTSRMCTLPIMVQSIGAWVRLNAFLFAALAASLVIAGSSTCLADQLQWNALAACERAVQSLRPQSLLISYCSQAGQDYAELWLVKKAYVVHTPAEGLFEVNVRAKRLCRSPVPLSSEDFPLPEACWAFSEARHAGWFYGGIDLAYTYIYTGGSTFQCLGRVLGLECQIGVETINLPDCVMERINAGTSAGRRIASIPFVLSGLSSTERM